MEGLIFTGIGLAAMLMAYELYHVASGRAEIQATVKHLLREKAIRDALAAERNYCRYGHTGYKPPLYMRRARRGRSAY